MRAEDSPSGKTPSGEGPGGKSRGRRFVRAVLTLGLLVVLLLGLALFFRGAWLEPLAKRTLTDYARELGAELTVERITGNWIDHVTLEGVRWRGDPPLRAVEEARIEVGFSLVQLMRGGPALTISVQGSGIVCALEPSEATPETERAPGLEGFTLERLEVDLSRLTLEQPGREALRVDALRGQGAARGSLVSVERLELVVGSNRAALTRAEVDLADAADDDWLSMLRRARGELEVVLPDIRGLATQAGVPLPVASLRVEFSIEAGRAQVVGRADLERASLEVVHGEVVLPTTPSWLELELALTLEAAFDDLSELTPFVGQPMEGSWSGSIDVRGPLRAPTGHFDGRGADLELAGLALGAFDIDLRTDGQSLRFERCEISGSDLEAVLRGGVRLEPLELEDLVLNVFADNGSLAAVLPVPCEQAFVHARLSGPPNAPHGAFEVSAEGVELGAVRLDEAVARGRLEGDRLTVDELRVVSGESFIEADGTVQRRGAGLVAELASLALAWNGTRVELERGARFAYDPEGFTVEGLELRSTGPEVAGRDSSGRAAIRLANRGGRTDAELVFEGYEAGSVLAPFLPAGWRAGRVDGRVAGSLGQEVPGGQDEAANLEGFTPSLALDLVLTDWRPDPAWPPFDAVLRGAFDGRELALEHIELGFDEDEALHARGALRAPLDLADPSSFGAGPVELELELGTLDATRALRRAGVDPGLSSTGPCRVDLDLAGSWQELVGALTLAAEDVTMGVEASARACDLEARVVFGASTRIERAVFSAPSGTITLAGEVATPLDVPRWIADRWALLEAPVALDAKLDLADLGWIAGLSADLRRLSGQVAGEVGIRGDLLHPELSGTVEWREGELRLASSSAPIRSLGARVSFEGEQVRIESLSGEVGGAQVDVTGTISPFGPFPRLDLALVGKNLLLAREANLRVRADADLIVKGTPSQLAIRGELNLVEGLYTGEISPLDELLQAGKRKRVPTQPTRFALWSDGLLASAEFDVRLAGAKTFEYRTNLLEASLRPDARLRGTGAYPFLEGQVYLDEASLTLPSGELKLASGLLTFRREQPLQPEVALTAGMTIQRHAVRAVATGTLDELEIVLSSTPPLPNDDLWILVLTGQLPATPGQDRSAQAMEALAVFLARDGLVRWFGSDPGAADSLLERIEIDVGAKASASGQPTGRVLFYLKPQTRRSSRATYLSAEIDEYDRVNYALGIVFRPR